MTFHELERLLQPYGPALRLNNRELQLTAAEPLGETGPWERDVLYLAAGRQAAEPWLDHPVNLLVCGAGSWEPGACEANLLLLSGAADVGAVFAQVEGYLREEHRLHRFAQQLLSILAEGGTIQRLVESAAKSLGNSIYVFDAGFRMIAVCEETALSDFPSKQLLERRYMAPEDMEAVNHAGIHDRVLKSAEPVLVDNPFYEGKRIVSRLNLGGKNVGHFAMTDFARPFTESDFNAMAVLRNVLVQRMQQDEFIRNSRGFHYEYLITDLLDGKVALGQQLEDRLAYVDLHFEELIYVAVVELARSAAVVNPIFVQDQFEALLPGSRTLRYNGQVVAITTRRAAEAINEKELERVRDYCRKGGLYCGVSNPFRGVAELPKFYKQALRALEIGAMGNSGPSIYNYRDYAVEHILSQFSQREEPLVFCHPAVRRLMEHDREKDGELAQTLYQYLRWERNVALTARQMGLHRNTLIYRLKRIQELTRMEFEWPEDRLYLMLSLRACLEERPR